MEIATKPRRSTYDLLKTSWTYQTRQFFDKSTLHGVRYINEEGRPFCERFMWFCFTSVGAIATLIIIVSLWEKFQTNPTITGLDTDFHNWKVPFPAISVCSENPVNRQAVEKYVAKIGQTFTSTCNEETQNCTQIHTEYFTQIANLSYNNLYIIDELLSQQRINLSESIKDTQKQLVKRCKDLLQNCTFKLSQKFDCCERFFPIYTEVGFCFSFNSRHATPGSFELETIRETDEKWALDFAISVDEGEIVKLYIHSNDEIPVLDVSPQHEWTQKISMIAFSAKETYTTEDARQLSIRQRRCVFADEIKLETDSIYTYSACTSQCRMRLAFTLCNCVPTFYRPNKPYKSCDAEGLKCLAHHYKKFLDKNRHCHCELGCKNTVYEVEKLQDQTGAAPGHIDIGFVSWPMVRYKREVLFGWVDLLVSFGGIAGLFLGFSLLSGVEMIYYFTMRACCMVLRNESELLELQREYEKEKHAAVDLSLTPYFMKTNQNGTSGITKISPANQTSQTGSTGITKVPPANRSFPDKGAHAVLQRIYVIEFLP
ncbi:sodium channel protein Nach-like [Schistocerca cancellata]|uniref:sodium channel protein Nach-like n=1 Tax=Schistocerca cancellata TaxID=274614 RepID=UPI00211904E6|nr:sodium channel protein Nach-like [Schistocerca cancellata]